ncbi:MAG: hypothetical protein SGJ18_10650 [Pseudomonadota bacterium]|nr:hypothetical protein [Pseudomonadota bacterium]
MLQKIALLIALASASIASAKQLSPQDIRDRLQVNADIYLLDQSGKKIVSGPERTNYWKVSPEKGTISGDWSSKFDAGLIAIRQNWQIEDDGTIKVSMEEYSSDSDNRSDPQLKGLLDKKEFVLENLEPIVWKVKNIKNQNFIVRFVPSLREISTPISVDNLPVAGTGISISDNQGYLWADGVEFNGKYTGVTSHRGTLAISYVPFAGAKEMGFAEGNQITLNLDKKFQINLKGATSFLPAGVTAKVYAVYLPEKKSRGFNSLHSFDSSKEERIQATLKK